MSFATPTQRRKRKLVNTVEPVDLHLPDTVYAYTDGSSSLKKGTSGGWAFMTLFNGVRRERFGYKHPATNNEMELTAILNTLLYLKVTKYPIRLYTDSEYCRNAITVWHKTWSVQRWCSATGQPVKNKELIERIVEAIEIHREACDIRILHIKGHGDGHGHSFYNNHVDKLCGEARKNKLNNWTE